MSTNVSPLGNKVSNSSVTYAGATVMVMKKPAMKELQNTVFGSFLFHPKDSETFPFAMSYTPIFVALRIHALMMLTCTPR